MANSKKSQFILASLLTACTLVLLPSTGRADEVQILKNQVQVLQQKVDGLQGQLADQNRQLLVGPVGVDMYDQWYPFEQMGMMERQMSQAMKNSVVDFNPMEDIKRTPDAYIISMDIPGMEKDKINIEVKNSMLIVSGDRNSEVKRNKPDQYYLQERSFGRFFSTLPLPEDVKKDSIEAKYNNGVLTVKILRNKTLNHGVEVQKIMIK